MPNHSQETYESSTFIQVESQANIQFSNEQVLRFTQNIEESESPCADNLPLLTDMIPGMLLSDGCEVDKDMSEGDEIDNMSEGDLSNLEKAPVKVEKYLMHDYITFKEQFAKYNEVMVTQIVYMLDRLFTKEELKERVLPNLKNNEILQESDFLWRISMLTRRKSCGKKEILQLIT